MEDIFKNEAQKHTTLTVILKAHEDEPLVYRDAIIGMPIEGDDCLNIRCNVNLPVNEDKTEYKDYELIEHIPFNNILRYYTLAEEV